MAQGEFDLIARYFTRLGADRTDVRIGVGDDGAVVVPPASRELVVVTDSLVEGVHFPVGSPAASVGHRAFAVNFSDLAAMGAEPAWGLLALTIPGYDEHWLAQFARAAGDLCRKHGLALIGGDTTRGPLSITVSDGPSANATDGRVYTLAQPRPATQVIPLLNSLRGTTKAYIRLWRSDPTYTMEGQDLPDPPPSVGMILARLPGAQPAVPRTATVEEFTFGAGEDAVISGSKTVQVEVRE